MKRVLALVLIAAQLVLAVPQATVADDSDIFGANINPNVVIIFDNSGSMSDDAPSNAYDPTTTYPVLVRCDPITTRRPRSTTLQNCNSNMVYKGSSYDHYADSISAISGSGSGAAQVALTDAGFWSGSISGSNVTLFTGNYINYLLGTCASGGACTQSKMVIAKRVVNNVLDNVQGVRFGIMTFYYGSNGQRGARVIAEVGSTVSAMKTAVNGLSPTGDTPLGDSLYDAGRYYKGLTLTDGTRFTSPIQLGCQPNYVILITDGMQTSGQRHIVNEATLRKTQDHSDTLADLQKVIVHTVGFGLTVNTSQATSDQAIADLKQAANNGGGQYFQSDSATDLERALTRAITLIKQATYTFANPVLPTTSTTGSTRAYLASFQSDPSAPFWRGYLKAYQRDSQGLVPVDSNNIPLQSAFIWDAGTALNSISPNSRTIYTEISGSLVPFTKANSNISTTLLGVSTTAERDKIIDYIRGVDVNDENLNSSTTDDRPWKLGDIFHSTPVLVSAPVLALNDSSYQSFKSAQATRTKVLIAGANDGMLHAFREADGVELWAFVPPDMLDVLQALVAINGPHEYFVDASPIAVDIKVSGVWKTIVVFGSRRGGPYYYALDITDTTNPTFLWGFTDSKIQETWSEPAIGKVKLGGVDTYVAFFGGGYSTPTNNAYGKAVFAVNLATGAKLWEYYNSSSSDDRQYMNFSIAANPTAVDTNNDGYVDHVYVGDVGGQLWKFDVSDPSTTNWKGKRLFAADTSQSNPPASGEFYATQAIYGAPALALDSNRNLWVFFGTGDRNHPNAAASNRFYGIKDNTDMTNGATLTEASTNVVDVTSTSATGSQGWFVQLPGDGEKVLAAANVFNNSVFFSTFTPDSTVTCLGGGGTAKLYALQITSGYAAINFSTGTAVTSPSPSTPRSTVIGHGIASMPVVVLAPPTTPGGATASSVVTATSNQELPPRTIPPPGFLKQVKSWRERIQ
ncbi:MAG TPA: PilC/PilY family type IV pilus protein [Methylomirabilota bacterium]|jgi:type IV pilus assembly protein PilY1